MSWKPRARTSSWSLVQTGLVFRVEVYVNHFLSTAGTLLRIGLQTARPHFSNKVSSDRWLRVTWILSVFLESRKQETLTRSFLFRMKPKVRSAARWIADAVWRPVREDVLFRGDCRAVTEFPIMSCDLLMIKHGHAPYSERWSEGLTQKCVLDLEFVHDEDAHEDTPSCVILYFRSTTTILISHTRFLFVSSQFHLMFHQTAPTCRQWKPDD